MTNKIKLCEEYEEKIKERLALIHELINNTSAHNKKAQKNIKDLVDIMTEMDNIFISSLK